MRSQYERLEEIRTSGINRTELIQLIRRNTGASVRRGLSMDRLIALAAEVEYPTEDELTRIPALRKRIASYVTRYKENLGDVTECTGCESSQCIDFIAFSCFAKNEGIL